MKKTLLLFTLAFILFSCKSTVSLFGTYSKKGADYYYELILNNDSTFVHKHGSLGFKSKCEGKWKLISKDSIQLYCNEEELYAHLQSGYMNDRHPIILVKGKRLKSGNVVMKKQ